MFNPSITVVPRQNFTNFIENLLEPHKRSLEVNLMRTKIDLQILTAPTFVAQSLDNFMTDWKVYECIMYHLLCNSIKHGLKRSLIELSFQYEEQTRLMTTEVTNFC